MPQIFHPSMNAFAKATIFGAVFVIAALGWAGSIFVRSSYVTHADVVRDQPVPFSHDHHVAGLGIDCRYCHTSVENSSFAGIPPTETCMGCHSQIWKDSPMLEPVRQSFANGTPLVWTRVHDLADFVYFNHSIHVAKGISCERCHGRVDQMPLMRKANAMHMEWCLECHRHPERNVVPREEVFGVPMTKLTDRENRKEADVPVPLSLRPTAEELRRGEQLVKEYNIATHQLTNCAICHR